MPSPAAIPAAARRLRIIDLLRGRSLDEALDIPEARALLEAEADDAETSPEARRDALITRPALDRLEELRRQRHQAGPSFELFFSTDDVIIVPGFMGSELRDAGGHGLIWIDPTLPLHPGELDFLRLSPFDPNGPESDFGAGVNIQPNGAIPLIYELLRWQLEFRRYSVFIFGFDWRKNIDESAALLADQVRSRAAKAFRPLHVVAHSQGTLVTRKALQLLGSDLARRLVNNLVLLGPAGFGTFAAAFAIAGSADLLDTMARFHVTPPGKDTLQSLTGLYQLLPWNAEVLPWLNDHDLGDPAFWQGGVDKDRLAALYRTWGQALDTTFFNDRTTIILGGNGGGDTTVGSVKFEASGKLVADEMVVGDGTIPEACARLPGVRTYKADSAEHMKLPATPAVVGAVTDVLAGRRPSLAPQPAFAAAAGPHGEQPVLLLAEPGPAPHPAAAAEPAPLVEATSAALSVAAAPPQPPAPVSRRLRVYSFDPLLGTNLDALGVDRMTVELPWDWADGHNLRPGPVGEYVEVIDCDPASGCFYPPADLNHPHLLAQDGLPPSEGNPQFHQQMAYAVAMGTILQFEQALGRVALWAPHLYRDEHGNVVPEPHPDGSVRFVRRLRIHPHALRQANAYYSPDPKALLFGYFPAQGMDVGRNLPGGTVFACLSHDVVAHETTHALLDGLHRYFIQPSNPDVFAFHEGFADIVALFQHFTHPDILKDQLAKTAGDLSRQSLLGELAQQFGEATGKRGALRQYLGGPDENGVWRPLKPNPRALDTAREAHERGAVLVAALFRAFQNIYENRVGDLRRLATGGSGILPAGALHPDLVSRLAAEAAKAAGHVLRMCIRALDYVPPVDITFGEYLRALITADYDLVLDDDRGYRVAVVSAFRDWGIYPPDVRSLSVDNLLWHHPEPGTLRDLGKLLPSLQFTDWKLHANRADVQRHMDDNGRLLHDWLTQRFAEGDRGRSLGLMTDPATTFRSLLLPDDFKPRFEIHSTRPCRRIGPDGQQRTDLVLEVIQRRKAFFDPKVQAELDDPDPKAKVNPQDAKFADPDVYFYFRGGCTLIIDAESGEIRYCIAKNVLNDKRLAAERDFRAGGDATGASYFDDPRVEHNPFCLLHAD
jgi:hypothetical protein